VAVSAEPSEALVGLLRCPFCRAGVARDGTGLTCAGCGRRFELAGAIPLMLHRDLPGAETKLAEAAGWLEKARSDGWYEPDDAIDVALPFVARDNPSWTDLTWLANGHSFQVLLDRYVGQRRGLRVLELGAAKAWAAPYWRERDCEYIATDILIDAKIGLGRGSFYGEFARVQADGEYLPFAAESFDVTYCLATLHHALDLPRMVAEMARVTRPGGVVAGLNEGTRGLRASADNPDQRSEKALGINEHVHTVAGYLAAFRRAKLGVRRLERAEGWPPVPYGGLLAKLPKVGMSLGTFAHLTLSDGYASVSIYARKPSR
jgi:SAM-dependent methyltransferase